VLSGRPLRNVPKHISLDKVSELLNLDDDAFESEVAGCTHVLLLLSPHLETTKRYAHLSS
jgi:hypothetical protein